MTDVPEELEHRGLQAAPRLPVRASPSATSARSSRTACWEADGVTFVDGRKSPQTAEMDVADVVVAADGTFPTIAVARGVPTVIYGQGVMALGVPGETRCSAPERPELYWDYTRYPFDVADGDLETRRPRGRPQRGAGRGLEAPLHRRAVRRARVRAAGRAHRPRGPPAPVHIDATRSHTTLAFADELVENPALLRSYCDDLRPRERRQPAPVGAGRERRPAAGDGRARDRRRRRRREPPARTCCCAPLAGAPRIDAALAERADALLSEWPSAGRIGELPRFRPALVAT